jgi:hypothetical protein
MEEEVVVLSERAGQILKNPRVRHRIAGDCGKTDEAINNWLRKDLSKLKVECNLLIFEKHLKMDRKDIFAK